MKTINPKPISYDATKTRSLKDVKAIVIHYTGNKGDTAENNGKYFATSNTRAAGAHYFLDQKGNVVKSVPLKRIAWAVGGSKYKNGGGKYFGKYTNANTVSIELCDIADKDPSMEMLTALKKLIKQIRKNCPNAKTIIRHYDVNGKPCPARMTDDGKWKFFLAMLGE